jgi:chitodextrinase
MCTKSAYYFPNASYRSFTVLENTPARVVVQSVNSPIIWNLALSNIVTTMTYYIYPDGKIYVNSATRATNVQTADIWSNPVIGLADPSYTLVTVSSTASSVSTLTLTDNTKSWTANQWVGYWLTQPDYHHWNILSNTANTLTVAATGNTLVVGGYQIGATPYKYGWVRSTDTQDPHVWSAQAPKFIFEYWDPTTPAPYNNWAKASILLIPSPNNPGAYAGKANDHDWTGFKRFRLDSASITIAAGQTVSQDFLIQLGAKNSSVLPDLSSATVCNPIANAYIANTVPPTTNTTDLIAPSTPTDLTATAFSSSQINLSWTASSDNFSVAGYRVYRGGYQIATTTGTTYSDTGLTASTQYSYTVSAFDAARNFSAQSSAASATTLSSTDTTAPTVPTNLTAVSISSSQINLSWTASTDAVGVAGYRIYRGGSQIATSSGTGTIYSNTGLTASNLYSYTVSAFDAARNFSAQSSSASATTQGALDTTAPTVPTGLTASAISISQINLSWTASTDAVGVVGYRIFRNGSQIGTSATNNYSDSGLSASVQYSYTVVAYDAVPNVSAQSSATTITIPSSTQNFSWIKTGGYDYFTESNPAEWSWLAQHQDMVIGFVDNLAKYNAMKAANPNVQIVTYLDHETIWDASWSPYYAWMSNWCTSHGLDPEDMFYHYDVDTTIMTTSGVSKTIKGYPHGTASTRKESRAIYTDNSAGAICPTLEGTHFI